MQKTWISNNCDINQKLDLIINLIIRLWTSSAWGVRHKHILELLNHFFFFIFTRSVIQQIKNRLKIMKTLWLQWNFSMQTLIYKNLRIYSRNYFLLLFCSWSNLELKLYTSSNEETKVSQLSSVAQSCLTLCDPMDCGNPGLPVHHQLPEFTKTHVHWVCDAIEPSHPLLSPFPPAFNLSQHQGLLQWVCSSHQVAKILVFQLQHQSFQWILRTDLL